MGEDLKFLSLGFYAFERIPDFYTFILLLLRFGGMFMVIPGIGGQSRMTMKYPAILMLSVAAFPGCPKAALPENLALMAGGMLSEILLGVCIGIIPQFAVSFMRNAGQLAATSMGLSAGNVIDPTTGSQQADLARIYGDLLTVGFLLLNGHHVIIYAVSGLGGRIAPGTFIIGSNTIELMIAQSAAIFSAGMLLAAPVIVALLLTQFVMGLVSKAVPTVNIFIVSFPLTIGIGLLFSILSLPDMLISVSKQYQMLDSMIEQVVSDTSTPAPNEPRPEIMKKNSALSTAQ